MPGRTVSYDGTGMKHVRHILVALLNFVLKNSATFVFWMV